MLGCQLLTRHHTLHCTYDFGPFVSDLSAQCFYIPLTLYKGGKGGKGGPPFHCGEMLLLSLGAAVSFTCNPFTPPQYLPIFLYVLLVSSSKVSCVHLYHVHIHIIIIMQH